MGEVSIPSQSGSLLSVAIDVLAQRELKCLNTLTVGQPLVGATGGLANLVTNGLNTLTVGQPLVGLRERRIPRMGSGSQYPHSRAASCRRGPGARRWIMATQVSIPSQSGSLLSVGVGDVQGKVSYVSIPSQSGSLLSVLRRQPQQLARLRLNTLTVGQPLVGESTPKMWPGSGDVSIPSQSGSLLSEHHGGHRQSGGYGLNTLTVGQPLVGPGLQRI